MHVVVDVESRIGPVQTHTYDNSAVRKSWSCACATCAQRTRLIVVSQQGDMLSAPHRRTEMLPLWLPVLVARCTRLIIIIIFRGLNVSRQQPKMRHTYGLKKAHTPHTRRAFINDIRIHERHACAMMYTKINVFSLVQCVRSLWGFSLS